MKDLTDIVSEFCSENNLEVAECDRKVAIREVDGKKYDGLTFRLEK